MAATGSAATEFADRAIGIAVGPAPCRVTVVDVVAAGSPEAHEASPSSPAAEVWSGWRHEHARAGSLIAERPSPDIGRRLKKT